MRSNARQALLLLAIVWYGTAASAAVPVPQTSKTISIRGRPQVLRVYGTRGGRPVIVSSGDGGWIHLGPHVADVLARDGLFVVGFDAKTYLESFTGSRSLRPEDVPADYKVLIDFASRGTAAKPILVGVSEGAGLSVLAASDSGIKPAIAGVVALGLSDRNELAWRWTDSIIYLTHGTPREPTFSAAAIIGRVAPIPLAAIHSTHDEYAPADQTRALLQRASEPKKLWLIDAANHRFSDRLGEFDERLREAIRWIAAWASPES